MNHFFYEVLDDDDGIFSVSVVNDDTDDLYTFEVEGDFANTSAGIKELEDAITEAMQEDGTMGEHDSLDPMEPLEAAGKFQAFGPGDEDDDEDDFDDEDDD
jgi:hypothetical protein